MVFVISVLNRVHNFMGVTLELICLMKFVCAPICKSNDNNVVLFQLQLPINDFRTRQRHFGVCVVCPKQCNKNKMEGVVLNRVCILGFFS